MERDSKGRFVKGNKIGPRFKSGGQAAEAGAKGGSVTKTDRVALVMSLIDAKPITRDEADEMVRVMLLMTADELKRFSAKKEVPVIFSAIAKALADSEKGFAAVNSLLDRAFGRPKQQTDITTNGDSIAPQFVIKDSGQADKLKQLEEL